MASASLISAHLEQISACSQTIRELNFPQPKIFTNALLHSHDITTLLRDTEAHERALFTVPKPEPNRRSTVFPSNQPLPQSGPGAIRGPRRNTAVASVLGGDLVERIKRGGGGGAGSALGYREGGGRERGDVDVDVLLEGAEKLCGVYPIPGAIGKINALRQRHHRVKNSIAYYEARATEQAVRLNKLESKGSDHMNDDFELNLGGDEVPEENFFTEADVQAEEDEIKELERKKRTLEDRVTRMEEDLNF
ncbi:DASH complex, subunit Spc34 [Microthyrium microscopicum]|uniref:DASH complex subunit SPC34 n=1 Tax=Microthyrium microscopicum TaxID=703497 RepID=A0A6A6UFK2_9PEZI|nr:DASH complex, subunit Spc34 [Microthyrium microscopicum]